MTKFIEIIKNNKSFILNFLVSNIILLIIFYSFYPGILSYDSNFQWQEVQSGLITDSHPFLSTYFMFLLSKIHNSTDIVIIFQIFMFSLIWGILCQKIKCDKKTEIKKICLTIIICLVPIVSIYSITLWKDILYTYYLLFLMILLYLGFLKDFKYSNGEYGLFGILLFLIYNYRHNGKIVCILAFILLIINILKSKEKKILLKKTLIIFITFFICSGILMIPKNIYLKKVEQIKKNEPKVQTVSYIDNYMLWMMGAHIVDNNIDNDKDLEFLNNILEIETWKSVYSPQLINGINSSPLNMDYLIKNIDKFRDLFIKLSIENPKSIIKHYWYADSLLINPRAFKIGYVYIYDFTDWTPGNMNFYSTTKSLLPSLQAKYTHVINITYNEPLKNFYQPGLVFWINIILVVLLCVKVYNKKFGLVILPMLLNTVSLLPINLAQDLRYAYINYLTFFVLIMLLVCNLTLKFKEKSYI